MVIISIIIKGAAAPVHQLPQHLVGALLGGGHQGRLAFAHQGVYKPRKWSK